jgi:hypothetical protein
MMRTLLLASAAILSTSVAIGFGQAEAQTASSPAPGSVTVRLNGRVNWYAGVEASSLDNSASSVAGGAPDGSKTATTNFLSYLRLYPGFDGVAANGLHYGAAAEIRESSNQDLYVFQAYGYLGIPSLGQVSVGQENGPTVIFQTGTFEAFNDGAWDGDIEGMIPSAAEPVYPFTDNGGLTQATDKIVYLSPVIAGFQFGAGFEPNHTANTVADAIVSSPNVIVGGEPRNLIDVGGQYTKTFGGVGIQIGADYMNAGTVAYTGGSQAFTTPTSYKDLSILSGGATVSVGGLTVGGNAVYGAFNQTTGYTFQLEPAGGQAAIGWLAGAQYTLGPAVIGGSFFRFQTTGDLPGGIDAGSGATITEAGLTTGQQVNNGMALGGTYTLVPGVNLFMDYDYGWRQQGGYNFATGNAGTEHNYVQSQLFGVGTQISW